MVSVRGRRRGVAPVTLAVFAGDTRLEVAFDGKTLQHPVHAEAGKSVRLDLTRAFAPKAPPSSPSIAPMPKRREPSRTPPRSGPPPAAWPLVIGGGGVALAGTLTALLASSSLSSHRDTLSSLCAVPNGTDQCTLAKTGVPLERVRATLASLDIQPTLTERPGLPVRIIVNRDLVLRPYQPMFFQLGAMR